MRARTLAFLLIAAFLPTALAAQPPPGQPGLPGLLPNNPLTTAARVASITVSPDSAVVDAGACQQFAAQARNPGGGIESVPFTFGIDNYVPASWAGKEDLYRQVIKPYCRTCHLAIRPDVIASAQQFLGMRAGLERVLCNIGSMPHAEVPFQKFWTSTNPYAPALLRAEAGISCGQ